ncbi:MAG: alpha-ketoglutarate-dependent 2,4-dichlorophenoxyacetate dioxygenase [Gammaproteobacteria bacterium]|jgi:alpha-ketoglutarate-dependent 2,4-dichlorophenoxyacetate dioxygenase
MSICVTPITEVFGATVTGIDLSNGIGVADLATLIDAFEQHSVLVLPNQPMTDERQVEFSRNFGPLEHTVRSNPAGDSFFARQSNIDINSGEVIPPDDRRMAYQEGNYRWHTDSTFKPILSRCSIFSAREIPAQGGATEFASTRAGYEQLSAARQQVLEGLVVEHDLIASRKRYGFEFNEREKSNMSAARHRLVFTNPITTRRSLLIGSHAFRIVDMPEEQSRALLDELLELSTQAQNCHRHEWREHDIVIWDNRAALHRATPYDGTRYRRLMQRTTVSSGTAAELQAMEAQQ